MRVAGATSSAQAAVLAYAGSSTAGQWFIPSLNELNELCKYARGQATGNLKVACDATGTLKTGTTNDLGGFMANLYWSSSEQSDFNAYRQWIGSSSGVLNTSKASTSNYVRPIRAF
jgi:hypothetical protein